jgi:hypothetical protein
MAKRHDHDTAKWGECREFIQSQLGIFTSLDVVRVVFNNRCTSRERNAISSAITYEVKQGRCRVVGCVDAVNAAGKSANVKSYEMILPD